MHRFLVRSFSSFYTQPTPTVPCCASTISTTATTSTATSASSFRPPLLARLLGSAFLALSLAFRPSPDFAHTTYVTIHDANDPLIQLVFGTTIIIVVVTTTITSTASTATTRTASTATTSKQLLR
jgi:hypothetical protein